ncbi:MAG: hypothetical protein ABW321_13845 [Polyangiales bacterium]
MLVEWVIVAASFVTILSCLFCVELYCRLDLKRLDDAREDAWNKAMSGCDPSTTDLRETGNALVAGEGPMFAKQMIPSGRYAERDFKISGTGIPTAFKGLSGHHKINFICNPWPGKAVPTSNIVDWLKEWF